ncbi:MAG: peptidoglycan-binding protein, partial [Lysobacter sp.]
GPVGAHAAAGDRALGRKYDTVRSLFLTPESSQRLVRALDHGTALAEGDPALHNGRRHAGFYADGGNFVHWNASGQGVACIGGEWRSMDPERLHRAVQRDGSVDLTLTETGRTTTLLHVDPHARTRTPANREPVPAAHAVPRPAYPAHSDRPQHDSPDTTRHHGVPPPHADAVHAGQTALAHLGYTGMDGKLVRIDGAVGPNSRHATEQFQRDHALPVTGQFDERTQLRLAIEDRTMASSTHPAHALYRQSLDAVSDLDRRMGIPGGQHSIALAGVAAVEAVRAGLKRVDRVELGKDGVHAQAVEFRQGVDFWATNHTSAPIKIAHAVTHPLAESSERAAQALASHTFANEQIARQQTPMRTPVL